MERTASMAGKKEIRIETCGTYLRRTRCDIYEESSGSQRRPAPALTDMQQ